MSIERPPAPPAEAAKPAHIEGPAAIESATLFAGRREVVILHNRDRYVLRITRQGKLILNK